MESGRVSPCVLCAIVLCCWCGSWLFFVGLRWIVSTAITTPNVKTEADFVNGAFVILRCVVGVLELVYADGESFSAPCSGLLVKVSSDGSVTMLASVLEHLVVSDGVPVAFDDALLAGWAVCRSAIGIVDIAGVDVMESIGFGDVSCALECGRRGAWFVIHFEIGMKGCEVQGDRGAEMCVDPFCEGMEFGVGVIFAGDQECGQFDPDVGFLFEVEECVEDGVEVCKTDFVIKAFAKGFEVDVGGVDILEKVGSCFGCDIPGCDGDGADVLRVAGLCNINGILGKDHGIIVRECHAFASHLPGTAGDLFGCGLIGETVHLFGFADIPILAKAASEIASSSAKGKDAGAGIEVIEWFFFDRIDAKAAAFAICREYHLLVDVLSDKAEATLSFAELAGAWAEIALNLPLVDRLPVPSGIGVRRWGRFCLF